MPFVFPPSHMFTKMNCAACIILGVVDANLRVYGTSNLRVVDAGILPFQLTSHSMSTVYAVAQKAADIILADA